MTLAETSECQEEGVEGAVKGLPRSQSERLLNIFKEHLDQEKELQDKYHDIVYAMVEKVMKTSQSNQMKTLKVLLEREISSAMRRLQKLRHLEVCNFCR